MSTDQLLLLTLLFLLATTMATAQSPSDSGKKWCVAKADASAAALQKISDYACGMGTDCNPIQEGGPCFVPDTIWSHASYVMNSYYHNRGGANDFDCDFGGTGMLTSSDPSDNLPTPGAVAAFLRDHTTITAVKLFDSNPDVIRAFADTNISLTLSIPNSDIPSLTTLPGASAWVSSHVLPFIPASPIRRIAVGNEVLFTHNLTLAALLLPALKSLRAALAALSPTPIIQLSTPHSFAVLPVSQPPQPPTSAAPSTRPSSPPSSDSSAKPTPPS
ncbi:hypothetical protein Scep_003236 [Stephania cephalantha]|uniref:X8 domain-containing protein n=1 Tax=Stephania cephalantha TaxID=152367 RepID=A0AAP0KS53_9MAGN